MQKNEKVGHAPTVEGKIIRTKMADAMLKGFNEAVKNGRNPGRIGRHILTLNAKGAGIKYVPREKKQEQKAAA